MKSRMVQVLGLLVTLIAPATVFAQVTVTVEAIDSAASESGDTGLFRITRAGGSLGASLRVDFLRNAGDTTCNGGSDCTLDQTIISVSGSAIGFRIPEGDSSLDITLTALEDNLVEGPETVVLTLAENSDYVIGDPNSATVTIADDAPVVTVTAPDPDAMEGGDTGTFSISRSGGNINAELRADFLRNAGDTSCDGGTDCTFDQQIVSVSGLAIGFRIPAGASSLDIVLTALTDNLVEGPETVVLTLAQSSAYSIGDPESATVTIVDDAPIVSVTAPDPDASEEGDPGLFLISRVNGDVDAELRVDFARNAGPASCDSGTDCEFDQTIVSVSTSVFGFRIPAGQSSLEVLVTPMLEFAEEGPEESVLELAESSAYLIGDPNRAVVTIADTELVFIDYFENELPLSKWCHSKALAASDPARFIDLGLTVFDELTGHEWSACALGDRPASPTLCMEDWLDADLSESDMLYLFNAGALGQNAQFDDWRIPETAEMTNHASQLRGCTVRW